MWKEGEERKQRVNVKRMLQIVDTIASACPFRMNHAHRRSEERGEEEEVRRLDVAQLLEQAVDFEAAPDAEVADAAE